MVALLVVGLFVAVVVLFIFHNKLSARITALEWKIIKSIEARMDRLESRIEGTPEESVAPKRPRARPERTTTTSAATGEYADLSLTSSQEDQPRTGKSTVASPSGRAPHREHVAPPASRTREEWEALIGGKILNRIGAVAIVIAMAFFMKYAVDQNWIDETIRVLIGGVTGIGRWVWGYFLQRKDFKVFAQGIVGAGIGILYLSVYAMHNFYALVPYGVAFIMMALVTAATLLQGLYYRSLAVSILGLLGGYMTPFVLEGGETQTLGLFTYVFFLNAGLLAVVWRKHQWWAIELLTLAGTWIVFLSWYLNRFSSEYLWLSVVFVCLYWGSFVVLSLTAPSSKEAAIFTRNGVMAANGLIAFTILYDMLDAAYHPWMGIMTLAFAAVYFSHAVWEARQAGAGQSRQDLSVLMSVAFVVIATWIQFEGRETVIVWSVEAAVLGVLGVRSGIRYLRYSSLLLFGLGFWKFILTTGSLSYVPLGGFEPVLNLRAAALLVMTAALLVVAYDHASRLGEEERWMRGLFNGFAVFLVFLLVGIEVNDHFRLQTLSASVEEEAYYSFSRPVWMAVFWSALSLPFVLGGAWKRRSDMLVGGLVMLGLGGATIVLRGLVFEPPSMFSPVLNVRVAALLVTAASFSMATVVLSRDTNHPEWSSTIARVGQYGIFLLVLSLLTGETRDYFEALLAAGGTLPAGTVASLANQQQLSISGVWLVYSVLLIAYGIWKARRAVRIAAFILFALTILKIFLYDLSYLETLYRIFSFIALGLVLLGVSYAYQRYKHVILGTDENSGSAVKPPADK